MKNVLTIVLVIVAGGLIYLAATQATKEAEGPDVEVASEAPAAAFIDPDLDKKGIPATGEPEWDVSVEYENIKGRHVFTFVVIEKHGWAANGVYLELWHEGLECLTGRGMFCDRRLSLMCDKSPLRFNTPLKHTITVGAQEFPELTDWGTSENWHVRVTSWSHLTEPKPM